MLNEEDMKEIEEAKSNILRGNDIESAALILEKVIWDNLIIVGGRVDITKVAVRQILNFIEEYKNKGYLDVVREKVKANEEITKLQKEIKSLESVKNMYDIHKHVYQKQWLDERERSREKDKMINLITTFLGEQDLGYYKKQRGGELIGQYHHYEKKDWEKHFEELIKEEGENNANNM